MSKLQQKTENLFAGFDSQTTYQQIIKFLQKEVNKAGFEKVIIACSGGLDSSVSTYLAVSALGSKNVLVVFLPYKNLSPQGLIDARLIAKKLAIPAANIFRIDISPLCDAYFKTDPQISDLRKGNVMARTRMIVLYDLAKKHKALVLGTENKSESLLGYFTRFGDEASDLDPLKNLYKTEVRILARYLKVPEKIISKAPTAGLWPGQTDEGQFGFTYEEADQILSLLYDKHLTVAEVVKKGFPQKTIAKVFTRVKDNEFKHHLPKVCPSSTL